MRSLPNIIAEAGVNHNGSLDLAKQLCVAALEAGANSIKFQTFTTEDLANKKTPKVDYQKKFDKNATHFEMLKKLELSFDHQILVKNLCDEIGIEFFSTPYGIKDAIFLNQIGVKTFKVASADIVDIPLHEVIASFKKFTIISTGMASQEEIHAVVNIYKKNECPFALLHTTSQYPTPIENANLKRISVLREKFNCEVGFSDHTQGSTAAIVATGLGANIFEKHFTLDSNLDGPDHKASANPKQLKQYIDDIRLADLALGDPGFTRTKDEEGMALTSRKSLHTSKELIKGHIITLEDMKLTRPGSGLYWSQKNLILGRVLDKDLPENSLIQLEDFQD
jgi:N,N'-diacetyllegionaminate synthase